jgi:glycerophosphoryl diester phosphodiesterase
VLIYSRARREIWRVADSTYMIDGKDPAYKYFPQEDVWCDLRRIILEAAQLQGKTEKELLDNDSSWDLLTPVIAQAKIFANKTGPYGYGVLNGMDVPEDLIDVVRVADGAREIVFASDGYPEVFPTFAETEKRMMQIVQEDPLMCRIHPQVKGVKKGYVSFDDRTYVRFAV